jgi:hypothetical protein
LPFLLLFGVTVFVIFGAVLEYSGITNTNIFLNNELFTSLGFVGSIFQLILTINLVIFGLIVVLSLPLWLLLRDATKTAHRFGIATNPSELTGQKEGAYIEAAKKVFAEHPDVAAFIYGHTHSPSLRRIGERAIINTGTWIKQFDPVKVRFGILPHIYVPHYRLSSFRIGEEGGEIIIEYREVEKTPGQELTWLQWVMVSRRRRQRSSPVPARTVLRGDGPG